MRGWPPTMSAWEWPVTRLEVALNQAMLRWGRSPGSPPPDPAPGWAGSHRPRRDVEIGADIAHQIAVLVEVRHRGRNGPAAGTVSVPQPILYRKSCRMLATPWRILPANSRDRRRGWPRANPGPPLPVGQCKWSGRDSQRRTRHPARSPRTPPGHSTPAPCTARRRCRSEISSLWTITVVQKGHGPCHRAVRDRDGSAGRGSGAAEQGSL